MGCGLRRCRIGQTFHVIAVDSSALIAILFGEPQGDALVALAEVRERYLAKALAAPLLFVGNAFAATDIEPALPVS